jgi:hypothetical protein
MRTLYNIFSVLVGLFFFYYFLHLFDELPKIDLKEILAEMNYLYVFGSLAAYLFSHVLRGLRIAVLMGRQDYSLWKLMYLQFYTNAINLIFPFKFGEVYRIVEFNKLIHDKKKLVLTIVTEKTIDLLILFSWALLAIVLLGQNIVALKTVLWVISSLIAFSLIIFFVLPENIRTVNLVIAKRYNSKWVIRLLAMTTNISHVIANIKHTLRMNASTIVLLTFLIWIFEVMGFTYLLPFLAIKSQIWLLSILVFLSSLIPSVSLGLGSLQLGFSTLDYHTSQFNSLLISITYQTFIFSPAVLIGFLLYLYVNVKRKNLNTKLI